jgi:quinol monooxygenase YgiN
MTIVRISLGRFETHNYQAIRDLLDASQTTLIPAIRALKGNLGYYVGIDLINNAMTNVSMWETLEDAHQMASLRAMADLAAVFSENGVTFERPITNHDVLWQI